MLLFSCIDRGGEKGKEERREGKNHKKKRLLEGN